MSTVALRRDPTRTSGRRTGELRYALVRLVPSAVLVWAIKGNFGESDAASLARERVFIDSSTMKPFNHDLVEGETIPVKAPSGNKTGYPAELCYWTKDGKTKTEPTAVQSTITVKTAAVLKP